MPASNPRALEKARGLPADALIFDLEDAVAPTAKAEARRLAVEAALEGGYGHRELIIRVNPLDSPWGAEDVKAAAQSGVDAVLLPKIESADQLRQAVEALEDAGAPPSQSIWVMAETPRAILDLDAIATASPRLRVIVAGTTDLSKALRVKPSPDRLGLLHVLSRCVLVARAHGLDALDGVPLRLDDPEGLRAACEQGRALGFDGKTLIHPNQIDIANQVFSPSPQDITAAERLLIAWESAADKGLAVVDGQLVEALHVEEARRVLALAAAIEQRESEEP